MRVTVLGSGGSLGSALCDELRATGHAVDGVDRTGCDLSRPPPEIAEPLRQRIAGHRSGVVVNCAAFTDVDGAEHKAGLAYAVNAVGAETVARAAHLAGAEVCHISTDFVFDGRQDRPYDEFDAPAPQGLYARSKYAGEVLVQRAAERSYIVRVEGLYGPAGKNFVSTLASRLAAGQRLRIDGQRRVTPTWTRALSRQLVRLLGSGEFGLYHATCGGETTWCGFADLLCTMAAELGRPLHRSWEAVATADLKSPAPRPAMSVLECRMLKLRGLYVMPPWEEALRAYLTELCADHHLL